MNREERIKRIAERIHGESPSRVIHSWNECKEKDVYQAQAKEYLAFLSALGCAWLDEKQELPTATHATIAEALAYQEGQASLISAGWRKVEG